MALTAKPISTIAYNTDDFIQRRLKELLEAQLIEKYYAIKHDKDVLTSSGEIKKTHWHVWVQPNKRLDTMALANEFTQVDEKNKSKPLKCRPFQKSNLYHWLRYTIHDPVYLKLHNDDNDGRHEYKIEDYIAFDSEVLVEDYEASASVIEMSKEQQRDVLADLILTTKSRITADYLYEISKNKGLTDGYWAYQNALVRMANDHNKQLEIIDIMDSARDVARVESARRTDLKLDEADITGFATIRRDNGDEYIITKKSK